MLRKIIILFLLTIILTTNAYAAPGLIPAPEPAKTEEVAPVEPEIKKDDLGRDTPRSMIEKLTDAFAARDYKKALNYMNIEDLPKSQQKQGEALAQDLHNLLDQGGWLRRSNKLVDDINGDTQDDLSPDLERVGGIKTSKGIEPILAEKMTPADLAPYWAISAETLKKIPVLSKEIQTSPINKYMPKSLIENLIAGIPIGHWLAIIILAVFSYSITRIITLLSVNATCHFRSRIFSKETNKEIIHVFLKPLQLFLSVFLAMAIIRYLGISMLARQMFFQFAQIISWVSFAWMIWNMIDVSADVIKRKLMSRGQYDVLSAIVLLRRGAKATLFIILFISILDNFGFQITTWIAALGIGGIAVALGTQKTVENFVGSLTLIADRPIAIGDFCKFGTTKGTVEDIGMRSTRVRTVDRTVIVIPNGQFSSMQIENYTKRDRFPYKPVLHLSYYTSPAQMKAVLEAIRSTLKAHEKVNKDSVNINFTEFTETSLKLEVSAQMLANNLDDANNIKEELNLLVMQIISDNKVEYALPEQRLFYSN